MELGGTLVSQKQFYSYLFPSGLVTQWNRVNLCLTSKLLVILYGPKFPVLNIQKVNQLDNVCFMGVQPVV